jgi:RsiW-degrading membrane proteinase PrsW (M82 family)
LQNFAASRDKDIEAKTTAGVTHVAVPKDAASSFDIAKFAGIFAAMGLAVGAIGTSLAAVAAGLFSLALWQIPLVLVGVMLLISGPSVFMAYLTLRRRNLGPLLDANGWAVNTRARINVPFGASLTGLAELPAGASRSLVDPFAEKKRPWRTWVVLGVVVVTVVVLWYQGVFASLPG